MRRSVGTLIEEGTERATRIGRLDGHVRRVAVGDR
jgi:hypothetical protein